MATNFWKKPYGLHNHICIALSTASPECFVEPKQVDGFIQTVELNALAYNEIENRQTQIERHVNVEIEAYDGKAYDWRAEGKIDVKLDAYRVKFIWMIT